MANPRTVQSSDQHSLLQASLDRSCKSKRKEVLNVEQQNIENKDETTTRKEKPKER